MTVPAASTLGTPQKKQAPQQQPQNNFSFPINTGNKANAEAAPTFNTGAPSNSPAVSVGAPKQGQAQRRAPRRKTGGRRQVVQGGRVISVKLEAILFALVAASAFVSIATVAWTAIGGILLRLLQISNVLASILSIGLIIVAFVILYRCWQAVQPLREYDETEQRMPTPGKAIGFLFIPFFNFYWVFVAWVGLARRMQKLGNLYHKQVAINPKTVLILLLAPLVFMILVPVFMVAVLTPMAITGRPETVMLTGLAFGAVVTITSQAIAFFNLQIISRGANDLASIMFTSENRSLAATRAATQASFRIGGAFAGFAAVVVLLCFGGAHFASTPAKKTADAPKKNEVPQQTSNQNWESDIRKERRKRRNAYR